uniref:Selenoprotein K n=1 Tax=Tetranychus urticae TaxID=32264 RepID=T1JQF6_TETUR
MVYINSRGEIVDKPEVNWRDPVALIFGLFYFILGFFKSLLPIEGPPKNGKSKSNIRGFSGPGSGPPPPPARGG